MEHILEVQTPQGRCFITLDKDRYTIGRSPRNSIVIKDPQISRHHATLIRKRNQYLNDYSFSIYDGNLSDKKSTNGLIIDRKYYDCKLLEINDLIELGDNIKLKYYQASSETLNLLRLSYKSNCSAVVFNDENQETLAFQQTEIAKKLQSSYVENQLKILSHRYTLQI